MQIIPVINNKGGVGKTTTSVNLSAGLARRGRRVLLVDLDSQGSASIHLGVPNDNLRPSMADVLLRGRPIGDAIRPTSVDGLDLVTGSLDLANADVQLQGESDTHHRLRTVLDPLTDRYDQIFVDCAPSTSVLTINALVAGDGFIIPVTPSYLALEGVVSLGSVVRRVRRNLGEAAPVLGIVITAAGDETESESEMEEGLRRHYGAKVFDTKIHKDSALAEAPADGQDVFTYAPDSQGAKQYAKLIREVVDRIERYGAVFGDLLGRNGIPGSPNGTSNGENGRKDVSAPAGSVLDSGVEDVR